MTHFIAITAPSGEITFAQSPPEETDAAAYMGYGPVAQAIPAEHASRTFDWATDDAWEWSFMTYTDHQVWHIVDGVVVEHKNCTT
jgi:hypothetical protein